ncbi:GNAT family N-acetyltransferase [Clostridium sardiniense]|uniref:GNAT family N-acetyltransferase n=1 Tax=Clostridium sardiniense TaxID=29369 RepID=UPI003D33AEB1
MVHYEKLNNRNFSNLTTLVNEFFYINKYRCNIISLYNDLNFIKRMLYKNQIIMILFNNKYIGYIFFENSSLDTIIINDLYIKNEFVKLVNIDDIKKFENKIIAYQAYEDEITKEILINNCFSKSKITKLLKYDLYSKIKISNDTNISFRTFMPNTDEQLRCKIQNEIFNDTGREPLHIKDIKYEESQKYYKKDLCIFILLDNKEIGYGQIVYNKNMYMVVNFGILKKYRGLGYGQYLLEYLINLAYDIELSELYIRVDYSNYKALNLYSKIGFKFIGYYNTWIKA